MEVEGGVQQSAQLTHLEMECNGAISMLEVSPRDQILTVVRYLVITPPALARSCEGTARNHSTSPNPNPGPTPNQVLASFNALSAVPSQLSRHGAPLKTRTLTLTLTLTLALTLTLTLTRTQP